MGRNLSWYVIPKALEHDPSKLHCFNLECEPNDVDWFYDNDNACDWCPKCRLFIHGLDCHTPTVASEHIIHSYSNAIWWSPWSIYRLRIGRSNGDFVCRFNSQRLYQEVNANDLHFVESKLDALGTPITDYDNEAFEETKNVLAFIKKYINNKEYIVIMVDEL